MKTYKINRQIKAGENYETMIISHRETGEQRAEYRLTPGSERQEITQMRRAIDEHLDNPGATLGNYQW
jgi:hypothetical protein